ARTTDDGKLVLPRELPDTVALAGRREWGSVLENLKGGIARRFALLQALPGAPSIAELESLDERHGENGDGGPDWRLALEELAARHLVGRRFSDGEVRFAIPDTVREVEWSGRLSSDETTRVLERSLRILRTPSLHGAPPERLALLSSISSRLGRSDDAL